MKCFICSKEIENGYFCEDHVKKLYEILRNDVSTIKNPEFKHHCHICGEYEKRKIVEYDSWGLFCDKDIKSEWERIKKQ